MSRKDVRLTLLERRARRLAADQLELERFVQAARAEGATWVEVAAALGITRQGAAQRFGRRD